MSRHEFDPNCPDCRPVIFDPKTGQKLASDDPMMVAINAVWDASPREDQEAFHRVTVHNGRDPADLNRMQAFSKRVQEAIRAALS